MDSQDLSVSKADAALRALRQDILTARLLPGTALRLRALGESYGVGWTPLREGLSRLEAEGLVVAVANRGFHVAPVTQAELSDLSKARLALELPMLALSIREGGPAWEDAIVTAHFRLSRCKGVGEDGSDAAMDEWDARHEAFHAALLAGCGSDWLIRLRKTLSDQMRRQYRYLGRIRQSESAAMHAPAAAAHLAPLIAAQSLAPHTALMEATLARDSHLAEALLTDHLGETLRVYSAAG